MMGGKRIEGAWWEIRSSEGVGVVVVMEDGRAVGR